jgi:hypothetical protein
VTEPHADGLIQEEHIGLHKTVSLTITGRVPGYAEMAVKTRRRAGKILRKIELLLEGNVEKGLYPGTHIVVPGELVHIGIVHRLRIIFDPTRP